MTATQTRGPFLVVHQLQHRDPQDVQRAVDVPVPQSTAGAVVAPGESPAQHQRAVLVRGLPRVLDVAKRAAITGLASVATLARQELVDKPHVISVLPEQAAQPDATRRRAVPHVAGAAVPARLRPVAPHEGCRVRSAIPIREPLDQLGVGALLRTRCTPAQHTECRVLVHRPRDRLHRVLGRQVGCDAVHRHRLGRHTTRPHCRLRRSDVRLDQAVPLPLESLRLPISLLLTVRVPKERGWLLGAADVDTARDPRGHLDALHESVLVWVDTNQSNVATMVVTEHALGIRHR